MWRCLIPIVLVAACSDENPPLVLPDAAQTPDGSNDACLVKANYGAVGSVTGTVANGVAGTLSATIDAGPPRDAFFLKLVAGKGVFTPDVTNGTYAIGGVDAGYSTCGLCVHIIADIVTGSGPSKFYFADSGSVTLTSTSPIMGSAQNVHLVETDATGNGLPVPGGCSTMIDSITFALQ